MDADELAAATPADRDRFVDLLRITSIGVVVVGHWVMAVPTVVNGSLRAGNALQFVPQLQYVTWLFQVMPLFFLVGGFADATALAKGPRYGDFLRIRTRRLMTPTLVFVGVWVLLTLAAGQRGQQNDVWRVATATVAQPLWFVGVYLAIIALAPATWAWHRRHGAGALITLAVAAVAVDLLRFRFGLDQIGLINLAVVWVAVHQLGYFYAEGRLLRWAPWMAGGGLATVVTLTGTGWYPVSMVGMPGAPVSNMNPPTVALLAHATWLTGAVLLLRGPLTTWLNRPRVWLRVVVVNTVTMTVFLWHLSALFLGWVLLSVTGVPQPDPGGPWWWLTRPLWIAGLAVLTTGFVLLWRRAERVSPVPPGSHPMRTGLVAALSVLGLLGVSVVGLDGLVTGQIVSMAGIPMTAAVATLLLGAGLALDRFDSHSRDEPPPDSPAPPEAVADTDLRGTDTAPRAHA
jgi:hypothetical protein